jgi:hypothetical protein
VSQRQREETGEGRGGEGEGREEEGRGGGKLIKKICEVTGVKELGETTHTTLSAGGIPSDLLHLGKEGPAPVGKGS